MVVSPGVASTSVGTPGPEPAGRVWSATDRSEVSEAPSAFRAATFTKYGLDGESPAITQAVPTTVVAQDPEVGVMYGPVRRRA